ncbi:MAG: hypothetical protein IT312_04225 [Anaerolineales bacterium]|nr:hypothetical protein [Anaerolineales bacterium]
MAVATPGMFQRKYTNYENMELVSGNSRGSPSSMAVAPLLAEQSPTFVVNSETDVTRRPEGLIEKQE